MSNETNNSSNNNNSNIDEVDITPWVCVPLMGTVLVTSVIVFIVVSYNRYSRVLQWNLSNVFSIARDKFY